MSDAVEICPSHDPCSNAVVVSYGICTEAATWKPLCELLVCDDEIPGYLGGRHVW